MPAQAGMRPSRPAMKVFAITGGIASGKSTFCHLIKAEGLPLVDCDALVHEAYQPGGQIFEAVVGHFGEAILSPSGHVDRRRLGQLIFNDDEARRQLDKLTHPIVRQMIDEHLTAYKASGASHVFVDVPLLFESGLEAQYDASILIDTEEDIQLKRLMSRNFFTESEALSRIRSQMPLSEKRKRASFTLNNNGELEDFLEAGRRLIKTLLKTD